MSKRVFSSLAFILLTALVCAVIPARGQAQGGNQQAVQLPEGAGKATVQSVLRGVSRDDAGNQFRTRPR